ncbi:MAG: polysaccharide biosynthesis protein [Lachnospiraceae bacterium]|nr:polysaccharide biosynthesis protein [Lachnospiraceae bacterium]
MAEQKGKVVRQAAFLMAAQMISSVIGLLYRSPLHMMMGDAGDGYYTYAYDWYTIILLISSYSIPSAVSKVMAERLAVKKYKSASKVFRAALIYVVIVGGAGALAAFFGAPYFLAKQPNAVLALRVLAPTIFLSGILGCFRGFFQAHNTMKPTAISQVIEQLMNAIFSVLMAYLLTRPYVGGDDTVRGMYGAAGGTIGTGVGVVSGLAFMLFAYFYNRKNVQKRVRIDTRSKDETYGQVFNTIFMMVTPIILATCVYNLTSVVDQVIFTNIMSARGSTAKATAELYGLFGYRFKPIINIPIALASATSTALIPAVAASMAEGNKDDAIAKIDECIKLTMFIAIPSAIGICILSYPVIFVLYPSGNVVGAAKLLTLGAISVIFYSLSTVTNGVLQGLGHPSVPVRNAAIALAVNAGVTAICVGPLNINVYGILAATVLYSFTVMLLNSMALNRYLGYSHHLNQFTAPLKSALLMGAVVAVIYWVPHLLLPSVFGRYLFSAVLLVIAVLAGILVYFIAYGKFNELTDEELRRMPMGTRMLQLFRKLHIR